MVRASLRSRDVPLKSILDLLETIASNPLVTRETRTQATWLLRELRGDYIFRL